MSVIVACIVFIRTIHECRFIKQRSSFVNLVYLIICQAFLEIKLSFLVIRKTLFVDSLVSLHRVAVFLVLEKHVGVKHVGSRSEYTRRVFLREKHQLFLACAHVRRACRLVELGFHCLLCVLTVSQVEIFMKKFCRRAVIHIVEKSLSLCEHRFRVVALHPLLR